MASKFYFDEPKAYADKKSDTTLKQIADYFGSSALGAVDTLRRIKISFLKRDFLYQT
ncbi:MAG: hypothetical protein LBH37_04725 [Oscillospiraceae bacterium]|jgi:hypothetical protein|nr:hypothetical protein [Oscillospiraceae bacterium]